MFVDPNIDAMTKEQYFQSPTEEDYKRMKETRRKLAEKYKKEESE